MSENIDMSHAKDKIDHAVKVLKDKRKNCDTFFSIIFEICERTMITMNVDLKIPRINKRQTTRANYPISANFERDERLEAIAYWRKAVYVPMLDYVLTDLNERFTIDSVKCYILNDLVPSNLDKIENWETLKKDCINPICKKYSTLLVDNQDTMIMKLYNEIHSIKNTSDYENFKEINRAIVAYRKCEKEAYPLLKSLLQILLTLPISAATAERSFSTLRRIKTWLRSRMNEDRLTGLAIMYVHRDIGIDIEKVINVFASSKNRKLDFIL